MRVVTKILELSKSRSKIYIDQEFAFVLYKGELRMYGIKEDKEVEEKDYLAILTEVLPKRAKLRSMNLLKSREYTEQQLKLKLEQGFYPKEIIEQAIQYVKSYGYIDDNRYARSYITYHLPYKSRQKIKIDLIKKGITKEIIEEQFLTVAEEELPDEEILIHKLLKKRHYYPEEATKEEIQKTYAYLYRKGFQSDDIKRAMRISYF